MSLYVDPRETRAPEFRSWQIEIGAYGNQALLNNILQLTCDTKELYSIDLLEIRYAPDVSEAGNDIRVIRLQWQDSSRLNDNNKFFRTLAPNLLADGSYVGEYNIPRNLYLFNGVNHRPFLQPYNLEIIKAASGAKLATQYVLLTLKVTAKNQPGQSDMAWTNQFSGTVLNDRT